MYVCLQCGSVSVSRVKEGVQEWQDDGVKKSHHTDQIAVQHEYVYNAYVLNDGDEIQMGHQILVVDTGMGHVCVST